MYRLRTYPLFSGLPIAYLSGLPAFLPPIWPCSVLDIHAVTYITTWSSKRPYGHLGHHLVTWRSLWSSGSPCGHLCYLQTFHQPARIPDFSVQTYSMSVFLRSYPVFSCSCYRCKILSIATDPQVIYIIYTNLSAIELNCMMSLDTGIKTRISCMRF